MQLLQSPRISHRYQQQRRAANRGRVMSSTRAPSYDVISRSRDGDRQLLSDDDLRAADGSGAVTSNSFMTHSHHDREQATTQRLTATIQRRCAWHMHIQYTPWSTAIHQHVPYTRLTFGTLRLLIIIIITTINRFVQRHKVATSEALGPGSVLVSRGRKESLGKEECL